MYYRREANIEQVREQVAQVVFALLPSILSPQRATRNCSFFIPFVRSICRLLNIKAQVPSIRAIGRQIERKMSGLQGCRLLTPNYFPGQPFTLFLSSVPLITFLPARIYWVSEIHHRNFRAC